MRSRARVNATIRSAGAMKALTATSTYVATHRPYTRPSGLQPFVAIIAIVAARCARTTATPNTTVLLITRGTAFHSLRNANNDQQTKTKIASQTYSARVAGTSGLSTVITTTPIMSQQKTIPALYHSGVFIDADQSRLAGCPAGAAPPFEHDV